MSHRALAVNAPAPATALEAPCTTEPAPDMPAAVAAARAAARPCDTVLLSPACASLDMFRDYAHRGEELRGRGQEPRRMTAATLSYARSTGRPRRLELDAWVIGPVAALLLVCLVMVASASIGIAERELGQPLYYFERQLMYVALGLVAAALPATAVPTCLREELTQPPGTLTGTSGRDVLLGTSAGETMSGLGGNDVICGGGGDDQLNGGPGFDNLVGGDGDDSLW